MNYLIFFIKNIIWLIKFKWKLKSRINRILSLKKFELKKLSALKIKKDIVFKKEKIKINEPIFISKNNINSNKKKNIIKYFPEIYISKIENTNVIGRSSFIIKENTLVHHDLFEIKKDICLEEIQGRFSFSSNKKFCYFSPKKSERTILTAASFLDSTSFNYAHWITEILPRIFVFCSKKKYKNIPLLIDKDLHKNYYESLKYVIDKNRKIFLINKNENIKIKNLFIVSNCGYHPIRTNINIIGNEGFFNYKLLDKLKKKIKKKIGFIKSNKPNYFFLKRISKQRNLINANIIEDYFISKNFKIVKGDNISFSKQFKTFYNAKIIIGAAGADFANLIFCKNYNTDIYVLTKQSPNLHGIYYWPSLFPYSKKKIKIILDSEKSIFNYIFPEIMLHENFKICVNLLKKVIKI
jgi:hypothetical protein